jgi:hypothetical protein
MGRRGDGRHLRDLLDKTPKMEDCDEGDVSPVSGREIRHDRQGAQTFAPHIGPKPASDFLKLALLFQII